MGGLSDHGCTDLIHIEMLDHLAIGATTTALFASLVF